MSTDQTRRVFYCADCGNRSRCLPLAIVAVNLRAGHSRSLTFQLELCPPCKVAWVDQHLGRWSPGRRPMHETSFRAARLTPADVNELQTLQAWAHARRPTSAHQAVSRPVKKVTRLPTDRSARQARAATRG